MKYFVAVSVVSLASLLALIPGKVAGHEHDPSFEKEGTRSNFAVPTAAAPSHYWPAPGGRPQYYGPQRPAVPPYWSGNPDPPQPYPYPANRPRPEAPAGPSSPQVSGYTYGYRYRTDKDGKLVVEPMDVEPFLPPGLAGAGAFTPPPAHGSQFQPRPQNPWSPPVFGQPYNHGGIGPLIPRRPIHVVDRLPVPKANGPQY